MHPDNKLALDKLGKDYALSEALYQKFYHYTQMIEKWNQRTNLVSSRDISQIVGKHIRESLDFCALNVFPEQGCLVDIGSGAGFPGIPIKILRPSLKVYLVESRRMKYLFLSEVVESLQLQEITPICERIENIAQKREIYANIFVARAVKPLKTLWEWCLPILMDRGVLIAQKGGEITDEIADLKKCYNVKIRLFPMDDFQLRTLIMVGRPE